MTFMHERKKLILLKILVFFLNKLLLLVSNLPRGSASPVRSQSNNLMPIIV